MPMTVREAERLLRKAGYKEVKAGGKGSHRKFINKAAKKPTVIITAHGKELSQKVEKDVREVVGS